MTKRAKHQIQQKEFTGRQPVAIKVSVVILGLVISICASMLVPPLWDAVVGVWQSSRSYRECNLRKDASARQTCAEKLGAQASRYPTKGANAPPAHRSSGQ
jgi:hypothetical protein